MRSGLNLKKAFRIDENSIVALVGGGGKTTAMFQLARSFEVPVVVTTSTHISTDQVNLADIHLTIQDEEDFNKRIRGGLTGVSLFTGESQAEGRISGPAKILLDRLYEFAKNSHLPMILEADGSRCLPFKAPADHEPAIPGWATHVVVICGLSGLWQPLDSDHVHRPGIFARLSSIKPGEPVTVDALTRFLLHPLGGLKNIPPTAKRIVLLNQADTSILQSSAARVAKSLVAEYDAVVISKLVDVDQPVKATYTSIAGIVLAAGKSSRMGEDPKVLMNWQGEPFVRKIVITALKSGLKPVIVVTGYKHELVENSLNDLPVIVVVNDAWETGQSSSIRAGISQIPSYCGAALFLLGDQPQITPSLIWALEEQHQQTLSPIIAPLVNERRGNPILFDRITFSQLSELQGDVGGRALFSQFQVKWLPWNDPLILLDVDNFEDYQALLSSYASRYPTDKI